MHIHNEWQVPLEGAKEMMAAAKRDYADGVTPAMRRAARLYFNTLVSAERRGQLKYVAENTGFDVIDVLLANLVYEISSGIGCTSLSVGGVHCRNLDWYFPGNLLSTHTTVWNRRGVRTVTWPGLVGTFTGQRQAGFSVSLNAVADPTDTPSARIWRILRGAVPAAWAIDDALHNCKSYEEAKYTLANELLISPCLLTLTGIRPDQGCVIQKLADGRVLPHNEPHALCTNDYSVSVGSGAINGFLGNSSCSRYERVSGRLDAFKEAGKVTPTAEEAMGFITDNGLVCNAITAHQVIMHPLTHNMWVRIPGTTDEWKSA